MCGRDFRFLTDACTLSTVDEDSGRPRLFGTVVVEEFSCARFSDICCEPEHPQDVVRLSIELDIGDLFHPVDGLAIEGFGDGDVGHGRRSCRAVPMLLARRYPNDIAGPDLLPRSAVGLHPAQAGSNDQRLTERVRVPVCACTGFKRHSRAADACGGHSFERHVEPDDSGEVVS